jgi:imidazolonepropionase
MKILFQNIGAMLSWSEKSQSMELTHPAGLLVENGVIADANISEFQADQTVDCQGMLITPALIDAHTHPVFAETRQNEFEMRIAGKSYLEIAAAGGGIRNSVRQLRKISEDELFEKSLPRVKHFLETGTATIEAKSGYGLSLEDEMKSLRVIRRLNETLPLNLIPTFLGAHEIPDEYQQQRQKYISLLTEEMIPQAAESGLAEYCDVFADKGVFTRDEAEIIFRAALNNGLKLRVHADEFENLGVTELAAKMGAASADHLLVISTEGISAMKAAGSVAILLPGTAFFLGKSDYAPARKIWDAGVTVALASDFNPGSSMTQNLQLIMTLACTQMRLSPLEAWQAVTINAARSLQREKRIGSLEPGKMADIALWNVSDYRMVPYWFGKNHLASLWIHGEKVI